MELLLATLITMSFAMSTYNCIITASYVKRLEKKSDEK